ncbi:hypothetical protein QJ043_07025 [Olsenella sp. YH-ols2217]|uniref:Uncharacterized protein n=2 Tax=Kribbibacterium absianum TaxID=3044210 RepID=A0ABT6ZLB5_9ACTN|nr:hypothetical protein [Olsenella sp. YH-ols2217]MDJ1129826.1 hypothetical protein [Olsenella sp. YH-ols2217]
MAKNGELSTEEEEALRDEINGAFSAMPVFGHNIVSAVASGNWSRIRGAIAPCATVASQDRGVRVTQNTSPRLVQNQTTTVTVGIQEVTRALDADGLTEEEQAKVKAMLVDAQAAKADGDQSRLRKVGKGIADWAFDKGVASLPTLLGYLASLF